MHFTMVSGDINPKIRWCVNASLVRFAGRSRAGCSCSWFTNSSTKTGVIRRCTSDDGFELRRLRADLIYHLRTTARSHACLIIEIEHAYNRRCLDRVGPLAAQHVSVLLSQFYRDIGCFRKSSDIVSRNKCEQ